MDQQAAAGSVQVITIGYESNFQPVAIVPIKTLALSVTAIILNSLAGSIVGTGISSISLQD